MDDQAPPILLLLFVLFLSSQSLAVPLSERDDQSSNSGSSSRSTRTFIVVGVVAGVAFVGVLLFVRRRTLSLGRQAIQANETPAQRILREARQNGTSNTSTPAASSAHPPSAENRRPRRNRRRASQASVKSLPLYKEEADDTELVLVRRVNLPEGSDALAEEANTSYEEAPSSDAHTPLMSDDEARANRRASIRSAARGHAPSASLDSSVRTGSMESTGSSSALLGNTRRTQGAPLGLRDVRGEAPAYTEHDEPFDESSPVSERPPSNHIARVSVPEIIAPEASNNAANAQSTASRASRILPDSLRRLFGSSSRPNSQAPDANADTLQAHNGVDPSSTANRPRSGTDATLADPEGSASLPAMLLARSRSRSTSQGHGRLASLSNVLSRTLTHQSNGSDMSLMHSRNRSGSSLYPPQGPGVAASGSRINLTSPSMVSLVSISSPLSHTVTRGDFQFPKGGPSAEQIKFLSSMESLGRFGVPFGTDAESIAPHYPNTNPPPFRPGNQEAGPSGSTNDEISPTSPVDEAGRPSSDNRRAVPNPGMWRNLSRPYADPSPPTQPIELPATAEVSASGSPADLSRKDTLTKATQIALPMSPDSLSPIIPVLESPNSAPVLTEARVSSAPDAQSLRTSTSQATFNTAADTVGEPTSSATET